MYNLLRTLQEAENKLHLARLYIPSDRAKELEELENEISRAYLAVADLVDVVNTIMEKDDSKNAECSIRL